MTIHDTSSPLPETPHEPLLPSVATKDERLDILDHARGVAIILVVFGHVIDGLHSRGRFPEAFFTPTFNWIYSFHVTVFFFISGLFLYRSARKPAGQFLWERLSRLIWPYVLWSMLQGLLQGTSVRQIGAEILWRPAGQFWFLYILILISLGVFLLVKMKLTPLGVMLACVVTYMAAMFGLIDHRNLSRAAIYAPAVGIAIFTGPKLIEKWSRWSVPAAAVAILIGIAGITAVMRWQPSVDHRFNPTTGGFGVLMTLGVASLLSRARFAPTRLAGVGSMEIFLVHIIAIALLRTAMLKLGLNDWWLLTILLSLVGVALPLGIKAVVDRYRIPFAFSLPTLNPVKSRESKSSR